MYYEPVPCDSRKACQYPEQAACFTPIDPNNMNTVLKLPQSCSNNRFV